MHFLEKFNDKNFSRGISTLVGASLLNFLIGAIFSLCTLSVYEISYIKAKGGSINIDHLTFYYPIEIIFQCLSAFFSGKIYKEFGLHTTNLIGVAIITLGYFTMFISSSLILDLSSMILGGIGTGLIFYPSTTNAYEWFKDHNGIVVGIMETMISFGSFFFAFIGEIIINKDKIPSNNEDNLYDFEIGKRIKLYLIMQMIALNAAFLISYFLMYVKKEESEEILKDIKDNAKAFRFETQASIGIINHNENNDLINDNLEINENKNKNGSDENEDTNETSHKILSNDKKEIIKEEENEDDKSENNNEKEEKKIEKLAENKNIKREEEEENVDKKEEENIKKEEFQEQEKKEEKENVDKKEEENIKKEEIQEQENVDKKEEENAEKMNSINEKKEEFKEKNLNETKKEDSSEQKKEEKNEIDENKKDKNIEKKDEDNNLEINDEKEIPLIINNNENENIKEEELNAKDIHKMLILALKSKRLILFSAIVILQAPVANMAFSLYREIGEYYKIDVKYLQLVGSLYFIFECLSSFVFGVLCDYVQLKYLLFFINIVGTFVGFIYCLTFKNSLIFFLVQNFLSFSAGGYYPVKDCFLMKVFGKDIYIELSGYVSFLVAISVNLLTPITYFVQSGLKEKDLAYWILFISFGSLNLIGLILNCFIKETSIDLKKLMGKEKIK